METRTVHFKINFPALTKIIRDEWCDWNLEWALEALKGATVGLEDNDVRLGILTGDYKMVADPDNPNFGMIEEDEDWKPQSDRCRFGIFVDPKTYSRGSEKILKAGGKALQKNKGKILGVLTYVSKQIYQLDCQSMLREIYTDFDKEDWELCGIPYAINMYSNQYTGDIEYWIDFDLLKDFFNLEDIKSTCKIKPEKTFNPIPGLEQPELLVEDDSLGTYAHSADVDGYIQKMLELDNKNLPKHDPDCKSKNGYITPDGRFYPCGYMEHSWLEIEIFNAPKYEAIVTTYNLIKCYQSQLNKKVMGFDYGTMPSGERYNPTEEQEITLMLWCAKHNVKYEELL